MYFTLILVWIVGADSPSNCEVVLEWDGRMVPSISYREIETVCDLALERLGWHGQGALSEEQMKWLLRRGQARRCLYKHEDAFGDFAKCYRTFSDVSTVAFEYGTAQQCVTISFTNWTPLRIH